MQSCLSILNLILVLKIFILNTLKEVSTFKVINPYAIICEYNPFHNGHLYQIKKARELGASHIVAIMSSCFVQRADVSILSKSARVKAALASGVDLVLELPAVYSIASAEIFAKAGIFLAGSFGIIKNICFGSECNDLAKLKKIANLTLSEEFKTIIKKHLNLGVSYPKASSLALKEILKEEVLLDSPNDILGIEYIKAAKTLGFNFDFCLVKRTTKHDKHDINLNTASSSYIRKLILEQNEEYKNLIPNKVNEIIDLEIKNNRAPACINNLERAILLKLRGAKKEDFLKIPGVSEGLQNRIYDCIKESTSLSDLYDKIKTKRYSHARIRRIILSFLIGITREIQNEKPKYIKVLGFNKKGEELIKLSKSSLPLVSSYKDINKLNNAAKNIFNVECTAEDIFALATPKVLKCGLGYKNKLIKF